MRVADEATDIAAQVCDDRIEVITPHGQFDAPILTTAVDSKARAIGTAAGHDHEHFSKQFPETGLKRAVLQKQPNNSTHGRFPRQRRKSYWSMENWSTHRKQICL